MNIWECPLKPTCKPFCTHARKYLYYRMRYRKWNMLTRQAKKRKRVASGMCLSENPL
ncbi:hypothetical protein WCP94_000802 (plasmid) [Bilophila wadsworthia]